MKVMRNGLGSMYNGFKAAKDKASNVTQADLMESAYFVPETMSAYTALQEMRKRRVHIAIVVDE